MTLANAPDRPREHGGRRPLWIAVVLAVVAVAIAAVVILGGRSRPRSEARRDGSVQVSTPAEDAADAVDAVATTQAVGVNSFGGPGSAADGTIGFAQGQPTQVATEQQQARSRQRPRRAPSTRRRETAPSAEPSYRAIGPTADEAPPPQT